MHTEQLMPTPHEILICAHCGAAFPRTTYHSKYCTQQCANSASRIKRDRERRLGRADPPQSIRDFNAAADRAEKARRDIALELETDALASFGGGAKRIDKEEDPKKMSEDELNQPLIDKLIKP